ncbi:hypothetical protein KO525_10425 [Psychrosphaera sp. B3R10]|uniref:hypothetical protein n=1 Tax=unclassified Psychrosphaera TaxID=2641570 RepID=UPI001C0A6701|nr:MULTISPECIES: hypothetical protein [unclassified Psychrosphaera]MBU2883615.1 hypothetical protein [Psychrosphaera sp. I2R16]MBU2989793.1 hypothetical protein [Psychrosphaera sp. B3R10]
MAESNFINTDEIDKIFGRIDRDEKIQTIVDLAKDFVKKRSELLRLKNEMDLDNFKLISHSLKSNCRYIGATALSQCSFTLEKTESFNEDGFDNHWQLFLSTYNNTMNDIKLSLQEL